MAIIDGFKLTFDSGEVFRLSETVVVTHQTQPLFLIDGLRNFVTLYNEFIASGGQPGRADSNYSGVFAGFGSGIHTIDLRFQIYKGHTETWGSVAASDSAVTKMQELNRVITTTRADSESPALLEVGEYNDTNGNYDPIPVAVGETSVSFTPSEQSSDADCQMTLYDAIDSAEAVSALVR